jgi:sulfite reductase alpha subunit-like flavoprotein
MSKTKAPKKSALAAWKAKAIAKLTELAEKYRDNAKAKQAIDSLIAQISTARSIDLARIMSMAYYASQEIPELREIIPSTSEVEEIFEGAMSDVDDFDEYAFEVGDDAVDVSPEDLAKEVYKYLKENGEARLVELVEAFDVSFELMMHALEILAKGGQGRACDQRP